MWYKELCEAERGRKRERERVLYVLGGVVWLVIDRIWSKVALSYHLSLHEEIDLLELQQWSLEQTMA